jgi:hypothetical protein
MSSKHAICGVHHLIKKGPIIDPRYLPAGSAEHGHRELVTDLEKATGGTFTFAFLLFI